MRHDPTHSDAYYLRALMLSEERETFLAQRELQAALYYNRDHLLSLLMLGMIYTGSGDLPKAHRIWQRVRTLVCKLPPEQPISVLSELTAGQVLNMLTDRLEN